MSRPEDWGEGYLVSAFVATDTFDVIADRCERLLTSGRRMALTRRYLTETETAKLVVGLTPDTEHFRGPVFREEETRPPVRSFNAYLVDNRDQHEYLGFLADARHGTEEQVATRWGREERRNVTRMQVQGRGDGFEDFIEILRYNDYGVGQITRLGFDTVPSRVHAEAEATLLDTLASYVTATGEPLDAAGLARLAEQIRYTWQPLTEITSAIRQRN